MPKAKAIIIGQAHHPTLKQPIIEIVLEGISGVIVLDIAGTRTLAQELSFAAGVVARNGDVRIVIGKQDDPDDGVGGDKSESEGGDTEKKGPGDDDVERLF